jgi:acetyl-CoA carboxylase biotin carboxyl carrier protein
MEVKSEIAGKVWQLTAEPGQQVAADEPIMVLESMKMEIPVPAPVAGRVARILVAESDTVEEGQVVAVLDT